MTEKQLIGKIKELRQIKPKREWVSLVKKDILGEDPGFSFFPYFKPAFAGLIAVLMLFGTFGVIQNSLPGDILYSIKRMSEQSQVVFVPAEDRFAFQLKLANDRLDDLSRAPAKNLAPTINEFQANILEATRNLAKFEASSSSPMVIGKIMAEARKLEENRQKMESMGMVVGGKEELENALASVVENLIKDLGERTLSVEKEEVLSQVKELFEQGSYSDALELYLSSQ